MKIEAVKNEMMEHIGDFVRTEAKENFVLWLKDKALPAAHEVAAAYTTALGKSAENETGWCRFRDRVFLPCAVDGFLWLCGKSLESMAEKQEEHPAPQGD